MIGSWSANEMKKSKYANHERVMESSEAKNGPHEHIMKPVNPVKE
jgi:hypothetical protein